MIQNYSEYHDGPHDIEDLEDDEEAVEDVVGGEHVDVDLSSVKSWVQHSVGEQKASAKIQIMDSFKRHHF